MALSAFGGIANAAEQRRVEHSASQQTEKNTTLFLTTADFK